jgi:glucose/mannose-6-phosphate isomerase
MLDKADYIERFDKEDMLGVVSRQHLQLEQKFEVKGLEKFAAISNIVLTGMGGSALAAEFVKNWLADRMPVPFEVVRGYSLPSYIGTDSLVIVSSYSGNTEETLSALADAEAKDAQIVILSAGGVLEEEANAKGYPFYKVPIGLQPRVAVGYGVRALADLFCELGLVQDLSGELAEAVEFMKKAVSGWGADVATEDNAAKKIANELLGHEIVVYGGTVTGVASLKWKINFNETSKNLAFSYNFSEFNHNEFMGWTLVKTSTIRVIELLSDLEHPQVIKRFEISNRLLSGTMPAPIQVQADGKNRLQQMLWIQILGDFVSVYLGVLNGIDPTPDPMIEKLKQELV